MDGQRVYLKEYVESDRPALTALLSDPQVMSHVDGVKSLETINRLFDRFLGLTPTKDDIWAIREAKTHEYVGHAALFVSDITAENEREILFYLNQKYWGRGLALEAALLMLGHAQRKDYAKVWATVDLNHGPSSKICERAQMVLDRKDHDEDGLFLVYRCDVRRPIGR